MYSDGSKLTLVAVTKAGIVRTYKKLISSVCLRNFLIFMFLTTIFLHGNKIYSKTTTSSFFAKAEEEISSTDRTIMPHECGSFDIRNECDNLLQLRDCTTINGYLIIVLLPKATISSRSKCDYEKYKFPLLREISDFFLFFDVKGLRSIRDLFPNLTVIRGRRLFLNYALGITNMPDLEVLEFKSLVAIQRGHVFITSCPKLCNLDKINWDRLTLSTGENHIIPMSPERCPAIECKNCDYCWSEDVCQKFENDNLINPAQGAFHCHEECLGGCYNESANGCVVCKGLTDHGVCVQDRCPDEKYSADFSKRCYTEEECVNGWGLYTHGFECVENCPGGFKLNKTEKTCIPCSQAEECIKECPHPHNELITIFNLADADSIKGCHVINASLVITIRNKIQEADLINSLGSIREINGHLKIYRSPYLTSLKFLHNLRIIRGEPLENDLYALIIYGNKNLKELWDAPKFELSRGSMFVHQNNKLCNRFLREFRDKVIHDKTSDSLQTMDQEVLCGPTKLNLLVEVVSHHAIGLRWRVDQTSNEIELIYRPIAPNTTFSEESELDSNVCTRINWRRQLMFASELEHNDTHYHYTMTGLDPNTKYGILIKTFGGNENREARSELKFAFTKMDIPRAPLVVVTKKTDTTLTLQFKMQNTTPEVITHFIANLYELPDDQELIDKRDYCKQPAHSYHDQPSEEYAASNFNEDYDDCCERLEEAAEDEIFQRSMREEHRCSLDNVEHCVQQQSNSVHHKPAQSFRLEHNETTYTVQHLERFCLYTLEVRACNEIGCSAYTMHSERTNISIAGDKLDDLRACQVPGTNVFHVHFNEPKHPNGFIVSYMIHFRVFTTAEAGAYKGHITCLTRLQHAQANYMHIAQMNSSFNEVAVRVFSLAGDVSTNWVKITSCSITKMAGVGVTSVGMASGTVESHSAHGLNVFLVFFLIGACGTVVWLCYKRRCWRYIPQLRRYLPLPASWRELISPATVTHADDDDRRILVDEFENLRFHNEPNDEYLEQQRH